MTPRLPDRCGRAALVFALAAGLLWAAPAETAKKQKPPPPTMPAAKQDSLRFVAYYFHGNVRCATCRKLEQYSRAAVHKGFAGELDAGKLAWRAVNVDKKENARFVEEFQLYTRSLVLVAERRGKVVRWKNLQRIWELTGDPTAFEKYVRTELRGFMAKPS